MIICELDFGNIKPLALVQLLLVLQDIVVEELLQFLVAIIDAKLLERVDGEVFCWKRKGLISKCLYAVVACSPTEAGDIKDADVVGGGAERDAFIDVLDDSVEQPAVQGLGEGVSSAVGLVYFQRNP